METYRQVGQFVAIQYTGDNHEAIEVFFSGGGGKLHTDKNGDLTYVVPCTGYNRCTGIDRRYYVIKEKLTGKFQVYLEEDFLETFELVGESYQYRPIQGIQYTGDNFKEIQEFTGGRAFQEEDGGLYFLIFTLNRGYVRRGDYIFRVRDDLFLMLEEWEIKGTYEPLK